jgi:transposase
MNLESMLLVGRMVGLLEEAVMPNPYSADLRERVLLADAAGLSPAVVAARFGVGLSTVYLWRQQARAEGRRCAKPHGGGRARGLTRRARRSCGGWWPSATIARWTNIASC